MNIAVQITIDGLIRSLRGIAHDLAESVELRYREPGEARGSRTAAGAMQQTREAPDERRR